MWFNLKQIVNKFKKLKTLGFYQDKIKRLNAFLDKILAERKTMNVEGGLSGGGSIGAAPVSGLARMDSGPAFGAAPTVTGPVNEGPLSLAALKLTVPLGEIKFNSEPLSVASVSAESVSIPPQAQEPEIFSPVIPANAGIQRAISSQARLLNESRSELDPAIRRDDKKMESAILPQVEPVIVSFPVPHVLEYSKPEAVVSPAVEPRVQPGLQLEDQVFNEARPVVLTQPALPNQEVQEEAVAERVTVKKIDTVGEEKIIKKKKFVVDQTTLANRLQKVVEAARQAKPEAERLGLGKKIIGWIVDKYFSLSHPSYMSKAVQPEGPDGTIAITEETIKAKAEFESEQEMESVVLDNIPVSEEEDGEPVSDEQVRKVFQDRIVKPSKPGRPLELVEKRVVQKEQKSLRQPVVFTVVNEQTEPKSETNLKDLDLAELFPKAA